MLGGRELGETAGAECGSYRRNLEIVVAGIICGPAIMMDAWSVL